MDKREYLKQLQEDCEKLKMRNKTIKAQEEHYNNELHQYCRWVAYYKSKGFDTKDSIWCAKRILENMVIPKLVGTKEDE